MKCINCGQDAGAEAKFCPHCGTAFTPKQSESNIYVPLQSEVRISGDEAILTVMAAFDKNQGFLQKSVSIVVTSQRLIIANNDSKLFAEFHKQYQARLEAEGQKGLGKFWATATSGYHFQEKYYEMSPEEILTERPKNYQINTTEIKEIAVRSKDVGDVDNNKTQVHMTVLTKDKKYKYILNNATFNYQTLDVLRDLLGARFDRGNIR